jgi:hypothetical protein
MNRTLAGLLLLHAVLVVPVAAQQSAPEPTSSWTRPVAHYGKWVTAAAAIGLTALAVREHNQSADAWDQLLLICRTDNADCTIGPQGTYLDPIAENHYQRALYYDARARRRLVVGQVALVIAAGLFIADLSRGQNGPPNIPFDPNRLVLGTSPGGGTRIGVRLEF